MSTVSPFPWAQLDDDGNPVMTQPSSTVGPAFLSPGNNPLCFYVFFFVLVSIFSCQNILGLGHFCIFFLFF